MRVWIVKQGEPLPIDSGTPRIMRAGLLAEELVRRGHEVVCWSSAFDHSKKTFRCDQHSLIEVSSRYKIQLLYASPYHNNVSIARIVNHRKIGQAFAELAPSFPPPDIVHVAFPSIRLAWEAVSFARRVNIPSIVDVRDLWPDFMEETARPWLRPFIHLVTLPLRMRAKAVMQSATNLSGHTEGMVRWAVEMAGRNRQESDRSFPMAYSAVPISDADLRDGLEFWKNLGLSSEQQIVCYAGGLARIFDHEIMIKTAKLLEEKAPDIRIVFCGSGYVLEKMRQEMGSLGNVILPGFVDRAKIAALMSISLAGLLPYRSYPSFSITISNKPTEYFSAGLPMISQLKGETERLLEKYDCGVTVPADPVSWVDAIIEMKNNPERRREMSVNASKLFKEHFQAEKVYGELADWLEVLVKDWKK